MTKGSDRLLRVFFLLPALLLALPLVAARSYYTGLSPLNKVVETMTWMFYIPILEDPFVQLVFVRFMLFLVFLAISHWVFKKLFKDNKVAGILGTAFSAISAFLMPPELVMANGGVITVVFTGLIPLGVIGLGLWFCVAKLDLSENANFVTRLIAIVILFMLLAVVEVYQQLLGAAGGSSLPLLLLLPTSLFRTKRRENRRAR